MLVVIGAPTYHPADDSGPAGAHGLAWRIANAAVDAGADVQFVGKLGDDAAGDALVLALGRAGIGHAAILRDAGHPTPILADLGSEDADVGADATGPDGSLVDALLAGTAPDVDETAGRPPAAPGDMPPGDGTLPAEPSERPRLEPPDVDLALRYLTDFTVVVVADPLDPATAAAVVAAADYVNAQVIAVVPGGTAVPEALASATVFEAPQSDPDGAFAGLVAAYASALDGGQAPGDAFRSVVERAGWEATRT